jgi:hypothetical protein
VVKVVAAAAIVLPLINLSGVDLKWYLVDDVLRGDKITLLTVGVRVSGTVEKSGQSLLLHNCSLVSKRKASAV